MSDKELVKRFHKKLKRERYTKKEIWNKYMKDKEITYGYFINQVNGSAPMTDKVEKYIRKYLGA